MAGDGHAEGRERESREGRKPSGDPRAHRPRPTPATPHRKSQSTSNLAALAEGTPRHVRKGSALPALKEREDKREKESYSLQSAYEELASIKSSSRRRIRAMRELERALLKACMGGAPINDLVQLKLYTPLLSLLARHDHYLTKRADHNCLQPGDSAAAAAVPEIDLAVSILQGLAFVSRSAKAAMGERWAMEMLIDLVMLLRTQTADNGKPTTILLMDLLCAVLVDEPKHVRVFESLAGLECITKVLRGTGVPKEVRMKSCEFLYFYLLPEGAKEMPVVNELPSRSASMASVDSSAYQTPNSSASFVTAQDLSQSISQVMTQHSRTSSSASTRAAKDDYELPFVPQTPRKPAKPQLGFETPSTHRRVSNSSTASSLTPVREKYQCDDDGSLTRRDSAAFTAAQLKGLGRKRSDDFSEASSRSSRVSSSVSRSSSGSAGSSTVVPSRSHRSSASMSAAPSSASASPNVAAIPPRVAPTPPPVPPTPARVPPSPSLASLSSSSRTPSSIPPTPARASIAPSPRLPRASTQLALADPSNLSRRSKHSKSPLAQSSSDEPRIRHSRTQSSLAALGSTPDVSRRSRGFPQDLTRGMAPSTPPVPLTPARRIPSERSEKETRSVKEKKELLGQWIGNVDQLVEGVQKSGLWR